MENIFKFEIDLWEKNKTLPSQKTIIERFKQFYKGEGFCFEDEKILQETPLEKKVKSEEETPEQIKETPQKKEKGEKKKGRK